MIAHGNKRARHAKLRHCVRLTYQFTHSIPISQNACTLNLKGSELWLPRGVHRKHTSNMCPKRIIMAEISQAAQEADVQPHIVGPLLQLNFPATLGVCPAACAFMLADLMLE